MRHPDGIDRRSPSRRDSTALRRRREGRSQSLRTRDDGPGGSSLRGVVNRAKGFDTVIVDTAGRLHIDDDLMNELQAIKDVVNPTDLLVADAMTGQDAIKSAGEFNRRIGVTGVVLTKLDGDARAARRCRWCRLLACRSRSSAAVNASRISSSFTLIGSSRASSAWATSSRSSRRPSRRSGKTRRSNSRRSFAKISSRSTTFEPSSNAQANGTARGILGMIPGLGNLKELAQNKPDEKQLARVEAIISSMTPAERKNDQIINGSRRKRIAAGSGTSVEEVNRLLKQFAEMKRVLQMIGRGGTAAMKGMKGMPKMPHQPQAGFAQAGGKTKEGRALGAHQVTIVSTPNCQLPTPNFGSWKLEVGSLSGARNASDSNETSRVEEEALFSRGGDRSEVGAREQLRREPGDV